MNVDDLESVLLRLGACQPALQWLRASGCSTFAEAWAACPRGSWLAWLVLAADVPGTDDALWEVVRKHASRFADLSLPCAILECAEIATPARMRVDARRATADAVRSHVPVGAVERALLAYPRGGDP